MSMQPSTGGTPFLTLEDVTLRLYDKVLFAHTHWRFLNNQHWAVIGGNGAGKSTLMRALCGQVPVVSGRITYHFAHQGQTHKTGLRLDHIAYVSFDDLSKVLSRQASFYQARWNQGVGDGKTTVSDYLSEAHVRQINPYQVVDAPPDSATFARHRQQVIELLGIEALLSKGLIQLSDGERRKTSIARALMLRPQLLILDNPLTGLDWRFKARLTEIIQRLMQGQLGENVRVIVATTRQDEIPPSVTHAMLIEKCRVVAQGPKETVLQSNVIQALIRPDPPTQPLHLVQDKPVARPEPASQVLVDIKCANVSYGAEQVLQDIDWTIRQGEHWALLGPNGAGKTTLLSLILGDHPQAYANHVVLFGKRRGSGESIWEIKRRIGWVAPELHLYYPRNITGLQIIESGFYDSIGLYRTCTPPQRQTAMGWMRQLGIEGYADAPFARLSEGEQRLVLLARALVKDPLLLILDEPCQGLDAHNRERVRQVVDAVGSRLDTSVIYVTHNADELPRIITCVLELDKGKIVCQPAETGIG